MNRILLAGIVVVALVGAIMGCWWRGLVRPAAPPRSAPPGEFVFQTNSSDVTFLVDPKSTVTICFKNLTDKNVHATIEGGSAGVSSSLGHTVPANSTSGQSTTTGPFNLKAITIEREGKKVRQEFGKTFPKGAVEEIRIKPDDAIDIVEVSVAK